MTTNRRHSVVWRTSKTTEKFGRPPYQTKAFLLRYLETRGGVQRRLTERPSVSLLPTLLPDQSLSVVVPRDHREVSNMAAVHVIPEPKAHCFVGFKKAAHEADTIPSPPLGGFKEKVGPWKDKNGSAVWKNVSGHVGGRKCIRFRLLVPPSVHLCLFACLFAQLCKLRLFALLPVCLPLR